eukprot:TRINITY_DN2017_c0_g1_i2.p2 TRINITY_DN2017_c0_g1~~TRINITY_DN2017_c0_g1_i2.p2  ORF type:complete len:352 (-),score=87.29 TRINITY_DN2017_c0_g1_i2:113-1168(-)
MKIENLKEFFWRELKFWNNGHNGHEKVYTQEQLQEMRKGIIGSEIPSIPHSSRIPSPFISSPSSSSPFINFQPQPFSPSFLFNSPFLPSQPLFHSPTPVTTPGTTTSLNTFFETDDTKIRQIMRLTWNPRIGKGIYCRICHLPATYQDKEKRRPLFERGVHDPCVLQTEENCGLGDKCDLILYHTSQEKKEKAQQKKEMKENLKRIPKQNPIEITKEIIEHGGNPGDAAGPAALNAIIDGVVEQTRHITTNGMSKQTTGAVKLMADNIAHTKRQRTSPEKDMIDLTVSKVAPTLSFFEYMEKTCSEAEEYFKLASLKLKEWNAARAALQLPMITMAEATLPSQHPDAEDDA